MPCFTLPPDTRNFHDRIREGRHPPAVSRRRYLQCRRCAGDAGGPDQGLSPEFLPRPAGAGPMAGWAYTIAGKMIPYESAGDPEKMKACQGLKPGDLSVW